MKKLYPGIGLIGCENLSGIYAVNEGIVDAQGVGIQHLFYKNYEQDLIHSACTMIKKDDTLIYGNRIHKADSHPKHIKPLKTRTENKFIFYDKFEFLDGKISKEDRVFCYGDNIITFKSNIKNNSKENMELEIYTYVILRNQYRIKGEYKKEIESIICKNKDKFIGFKVDNPDKAMLVEESPTGFLYKTAQTLFYNEDTNKTIDTKSMVGVILGKKVMVKANENTVFSWSIIVNDDLDMLEKNLKEINIDNAQNEATCFWNNWLSEGEDIHIKDEDLNEHGMINLIAIKAACNSGFVPADLTGHYYALGSPCYYARDSIMVARAFLLSGHYREFKDIMKYLIQRETKANGEFCQRYNGLGQPSEGANNNVFHQLDSIGYFARIIRNYYFREGELLLDYDKFKKYVNVLLGNERKNGMIGPEGGVNEGVFGPAFITSSNMYIYGGLIAAIDIAKEFNDKESAEVWKVLADEIYCGIQSTLSEDSTRYYYGYVEYNDTVVKKYDTPQYFGPLYGYPNDKGMKNTNKFYLKNASFYNDGIGYSEQEYHHGPWIFNTAACAQYCAVTGDYNEYMKKLRWILKHSNGYGLMPEAIDADDENKCMINPLTWACAEFVSSIFIINTIDGHLKGNSPIYLNIKQ